MKIEKEGEKINEEQKEKEEREAKEKREKLEGLMKDIIAQI